MRKSILVMDDEVSTAITAPGGHGVARDAAHGTETEECSVEAEEATFCCCYSYLLIGGILSSNILLIVCWTICFIVDFPPDTLLRSELSPGTLYFEVSCPQDTLLRSKLSPGHFTSKQTVPSQGGQSTSRGVTFLRSKVSGADSLLRSKVSGGQFASK